MKNTYDANTATAKHGLRRFIGKFWQFTARHFPFLPSIFRVRLQALHGVNFSDGKTVFLGEDVYFDNLYPELISVGRYVRITHGAKILSHFIDTKYVPEPNRPFRFYYGRVVIGDYVFIGTGAVIAKPVYIGAWSVIGANTVVTKDIPRGAIVSGNPATIIGYRNIPEGTDDCSN
jgi:acetyltransferase-like isoleucine patch superfamily enzyme